MKLIIDIPELFARDSGIYKISNNKNENLYIGRTKNFIGRAKRHEASFRYGTCNRKFFNFIEDNPDVEFRFEVVKFSKDLKRDEEKLISFFNCVENGFNVLHKDEDFYGIKFPILSQKPSKRLSGILSKVDFSKTENYAPLRSGYIRENGKLHKNRKLADAILRSLAAKKKRISMRDKNWTPADLSFNTERVGGFGQNESNNGQGIHQT